MAANSAQTTGDQTPVAHLKFETAVAELEAIVRNMEGNAANVLDLEASIAAYQRGMALLQHCQGQLANAEQRIQTLSATNPTEASP